MTRQDMADKPILVTGATGYVGGRLVPLLLEQGYRVRAAGRSVEKILYRPWGGHKRLEPVQADLQDRESMIRACEGCSAAYYLVHSMSGKNTDFALADRRAAYNMVHAANAANLSRILYLGGLGDEANLSEHLKSRAETAEILALSTARLTYFRAAMLLGSGSASFEILRYLADRLPVMVTPRWVNVKTQPIAISNVLEYLVRSLEHPETEDRTFDIGGPDVLTFAEMFQVYAESAGLSKRFIIPVPVLTPSLSSHWLNFITPVPIALASPLIEGLRNETVCREHSIRSIIPQDLLSVRETFERALQKIEQNKVDTCYFDAGSTIPPEWTICGDASYAGGDELQCGYETTLAGTPEQIWPTIARIGGETGWYAFNNLWKLRGAIDKMLGGVGLRRGRRDPQDIREGDGLDFWRVIRVQPNSNLALHAEMKLPGDAILEFILEPQGKTTKLVMQSHFLPRGLLGLLYWYSVYPLHHIVFSGMLQGMAKATGLGIESPPKRFTKVWKNACNALPFARKHTP